MYVVPTTFICYNKRGILDGIPITAHTKLRCGRRELLNLDELLHLMKSSQPFCGLPPDILAQKLLPHGKLQAFSAGEYIISLQEQVDRIGIVAKGEIHILQLFSDGGYSLMGTLRPSYILAADLICTRSRRSPYFAVSAIPSQVLFFPAELFLTPGTLSEPDRLNILNRLLTLVSNENMRKYSRIAILSQKGLRERILTYLTMQADKRGSSAFEIPFTREELAAFLCVNRSALSHELSRMEQEGLIRFHKNAFTLLTAGDARQAPGG